MLTTKYSFIGLEFNANLCKRQATVSVSKIWKILCPRKAQAGTHMLKYGMSWKIWDSWQPYPSRSYRSSTSYICYPIIFILSKTFPNLNVFCCANVVNYNLFLNSLHINISVTLTQQIHSIVLTLKGMRFSIYTLGYARCQNLYIRSSL